MARVSVYITNHNYGRYVEQAIQSVLDQSLQSFELIIVDDGSTDSSREILLQYERPGRVFVVFQKNLGLIAATNVAVKLARGEYVMRLDADDYLHPVALERMVGALDSNPDAALIFPDYYLVDEAGSVMGQVRRHDFGRDVSLLDQPAHGACTMIRRRCLLEVGGYDETFNCQDGYDLWLKMTERYRVININLPLFYYRQHKRSLTRDEARLYETRSGIMAKAAGRRQLDKTRALGVVPVRGHASDPSSIALDSLGGRAVVDWTLDSVLSAGQIIDVVLTSPDSDVLEHVERRYSGNVQILERSPTLARINQGGEEAVLDAFKRWRGNGSDIDAIAVLFVEAPFRKSHYIDQALNALALHEADCVDAVRPDESLFYLHDGHGLNPWPKDKLLRLEREDLYRRAGGMHVVRRSYLESTGNLMGGRMGHVVLDEESAFTIRSEFDWRLAQHLAAQIAGLNEPPSA